MIPKLALCRFLVGMVKGMDANLGPADRATVFMMAAFLTLREECEEAQAMEGLRVLIETARAKLEATKGGSK